MRIRGIERINFYKWYGLINLVRVYKQNLQREERDAHLEVENIVIKDMIVHLNTVTSKQVYWHIIEKRNTVVPTAQRKLARWLENEIIRWEEAYMTPILSTEDTKLRSFQYRLLNNILPTKQNLYTWKIIASPICSYCQLENETLYHVFFYCNAVRNFWAALLGWFENETTCKIDFTAYNILFGTETEINHYALINQILILAKVWILNCRDSANLSFNGFKHYLKSCILIEKEIAQRSEK